MFEITMLIPLNANPDQNGDRIAFSDGHHAAFEAVAFDLLGGITRLPELAKGSYRGNDGERIDDLTRQYVIAITLEQGSKVAELARFACAHYEQECIGVRYLGQFEMLR